VQHSQSLGRLAPALVAAQSELRGIGKDSKNPEFRSEYLSLDKIISTVRPILAKNGLALVQGAEPYNLDSLIVESRLIHSSGEWLSSTVVMPLIGRQLKGGVRGPVDPQASGSTISYGRRYSLSALLSLSTDEDDDGNAASDYPEVEEEIERTEEHTGLLTYIKEVYSKLEDDTEGVVAGEAVKLKDFILMNGFAVSNDLSLARSVTETLEAVTGIQKGVLA
jgi:hypothetical protein